jgi:FMN-dependent NADH-azoreductase
MARFLYIESSPRKQRSASIEVARHFLDAAAGEQSGNFIDKLDLWAKPLPEFDQAAIDAKYAVMHGHSFSAPQKTAWAQLEAMCDRFKAADKYVFSVPMWNFGIPYKLKHYLDLIMQPGLTFAHTAETGYYGLLSDKKALLVLSSGGAYPQGSAAEAYDFQSRYLKLALNFMGIKDIQEIRVAPMLSGGPEAAEAQKAAAKNEAAQLAAQF